MYVRGYLQGSENGRVVTTGYLEKELPPFLEFSNILLLKK